MNEEVAGGREAVLVLTHDSNNSISNTGSSHLSLYVPRHQLNYKLSQCKGQISRAKGSALSKSSLSLEFAQAANQETQNSKEVEILAEIA